MRLLQIVRECNGGLGAYGIGQRVSDDVRIAVSIAANPRSHAQKRRQTEPRRARIALQAPLQHGIEPRQLFEKGVTVIGETVFDFVEHTQSRKPQHRRLPQSENVAVHRGLELSGLFRSELYAIAPLQQPGNFAFGIEDALTLNFGRVRGEHRTQYRSC